MPEILLKQFQDEFLFSEKKFPSLISSVGTGKTFMLLLKAWKHMEKYPGSTALIVRKEYTDLRDSTIKDFRRYFGASVNSDKEYKDDKGSVIMFRHGDELDVLKNMSLSFVGIEQAEEFKTEEQFIYLRDRLRHPIGTRQLCTIANANGHNWMWKLWKNNPPSEEYHLVTATTFDNADNLPADFIEDLKRMEADAPNHYKRFVLNSFEEVEEDDYIFTIGLLDESKNLVMPERKGIRILACDPARFGNDKTVFTIIENKGFVNWEQIFVEEHRNKDLMWTCGRFIDLKKDFGTQKHVVDGDGLGGGLVDRLRQCEVIVTDFRNGMTARNEEDFGNIRSESYFYLKSLLMNKYLKIMNNHTLIDELLTLRYKYDNKNRKVVVSKDDLRKEGIKSPDSADALMMACSAISRSAVICREPIRIMGKVY